MAEYSYESPWEDLFEPEDLYEYHQGDEAGICINCGAEMDYNPMHPWCVDCSEDDDEDDSPLAESMHKAVGKGHQTAVNKGKIKRYLHAAGGAGKPRGRRRNRGRTT